jgi:hypothetical protein
MSGVCIDADVSTSTRKTGFSGDSIASRTVLGPISSSPINPINTQRMANVIVTSARLSPVERAQAHTARPSSTARHVRVGAAPKYGRQSTAMVNALIIASNTPAGPSRSRGTPSP